MTKVSRPREYVTPFLRGKVWWARVPRIGADGTQRSLGVSGKENRDRAVQVCDFLRWLRARPDAWLLDQMADGHVRVQPVYRAYIENRLPAFIVDLREGVSDPDLEPMVAGWVKEMERRRKPSPAVRRIYERQVRELMPAGVPFRRSAFTKQVIRDWLASLDIGQPNRHRAALSNFANFLMFEDVIPTNVVKQVPMAKEAEPRTLHLTQDEAKRLVEAFPSDTLYRPLHALMLATGMEFGAAVAVRPEDIGDGQVYAAGTKRAHRRRTVGIYDRWSWAWEIATAEILNWERDRQVFKSITIDKSHRALKRALTVANLPAEYTTHDHRHTWAVQAIKDRLPLPMIAHNLGHRDSAMLLKVYGRFAPTGADFSRITSISATAAIAAGPSE